MVVEEKALLNEFISKSGFTVEALAKHAQTTPESVLPLIDV